MQGSYNHRHNNYRCTHADEYAPTNGIHHPRALYLREDRITSAHGGWISTVFDDEHAESAWQAIAETQQPDDAAAARREAAERKVAGCKDRLAKHRAALDADPLVGPTRAKLWSLPV